MMKKVCTISNRIRGYWIFSFLILMQFTVAGQISHNVDVINWEFKPDTITISVGDTVIWTNSNGTHNVNGLQSDYPSNPESFGNDVGRDWKFSYVFTKLGVNDYQCDPHVASGMFGVVIVQESGDTLTGLDVDTRGFDLSVYPNPANNMVKIELDKTFESVAIISMSGCIMKHVKSIGSSYLEISLEGIPSGLYILEILTSNDEYQIGRLVKR